MRILFQGNSFAALCVCFRRIERGGFDNQVLEAAAFADEEKGGDDGGEEIGDGGAPPNPGDAVEGGQKENEG